MKRLSLSPQTGFYAAGALSTAASIKGTAGYLMTETNGDLLLATAGAVALGIAVYVGCEVAFNHRGTAKRVIAGLIAASAIALSSYTIYQHMTLPAVQAKQAEVRAAATKAEAEAQRLRQQQDDAIAVLQQQQADLRQQIDDLRQLNAADAARVAELDAATFKGAAWQATSLRKIIEARNAEIAKISERLESYTKRLAAPVSQKAVTVYETAAPANNASVPLDYATLARACLYDLMTLLLVLFAGWFKTHKREQDKAELLSLQAAKAEAKETLQQLQNAIVACNGAIAHANDAAIDCNRLQLTAIDGGKSLQLPAIEKAGDNSRQLTWEAAINLLKNKKITPTEDNAITLGIIMQATGWGRTKATDLREFAFKNGYLSRDAKGKGFTYFYSDPMNNIVQLSTRTA